MFAGGERRDDSLVAIIRDQVLRVHGKALVIYRNAHFGSLQQSNPGKVFVVNLLGGSGPGYESLDKAVTLRATTGAALSKGSACRKCARESVLLGYAPIRAR